MLADEISDLIGLGQDLFPLVRVEGGREAPKPVERHRTLGAYLQMEFPTLFQRLVLGPKFLDLGS